MKQAPDFSQMLNEQMGSNKPSAESAMLNSPVNNAMSTMLSSNPQMDASKINPFETQGANQKKSLSRNDYSIRFPDHMDHNHVDNAMLDRYRDFCVQSGLSTDQAQQAVDFYLAEQNLANIEGSEHCEAILRQVWQGNYQRRLGLARQASAVMNKRLDGRLAALLAAGLGNNPVFAELMALVGEAISEDSLGLSQSGSEFFSPMSTEEFLRTEVFRERK